MVCMALDYPAGDDADPILRHQLDRDPGTRVAVLEVVDELGQVLNGVYVMVRRRANEADAWGSHAGLRNISIHFDAR